MLALLYGQQRPAVEHLGLQVVRKHILDREIHKEGLLLEPCEAQCVHAFLALHQVLHLHERHHLRQVIHHAAQSEVLRRQVLTQYLCYLIMPHHRLAHIETMLAADSRHQHIAHILIKGKPRANKPITAFQSVFVEQLRAQVRFRQVLARVFPPIRLPDDGVVVLLHLLGYQRVVALHAQQRQQWFVFLGKRLIQQHQQSVHRHRRFAGGFQIRQACQ